MHIRICTCPKTSVDGTCVHRFTIMHACMHACVYECFVCAYLSVLCTDVFCERHAYIHTHPRARAHASRFGISEAQMHAHKYTHTHITNNKQIQMELLTNSTPARVSIKRTQTRHLEGCGARVRVHTQILEQRKDEQKQNHPPRFMIS
jgi:hypothetical protein